MDFVRVAAILAVVVSSIVVVSSVSAEIEPFSYECALQNHIERDASFPSISNIKSINLRVTHRVTHQLITRIFAIFLREIMKYENKIYLKPYNDQWEDLKDYTDKVLEYSSIIALHNDEHASEASINLEVWRTPDHQNMFPESIFEGNSLSEEDIARYGLYIPSKLINRQANEKYHYNVFNPSDSSYDMKIIRQFVPDRRVSELLKEMNTENINGNGVNEGIYKPDHCFSETEPCALVLTSHYTDTSFFLRHIEKFKLKMTVYFFGDLLKEMVQNLSNVMEKQSRKKFLVLHWTPSEIIDGLMAFDEIEMPRCEMYKNANTSCKFEANSIAIYFNKEVEDSELLNVVKNVKFKSLKPLIKNFYEPKFASSLKTKYRMYAYNETNDLLYEKSEIQKDIEEIYNDIACNWLRNNSQIYDPDHEDKWFILNDEIKIYLGGIFPLRNSGKEYDGIPTAVKIAETELERHSGLSKYRFEMNKFYTECRSDTVLNKFIHFYSKRKYLLGVLGPACSSAVEPIAAISKHYQLSVMTYSAEGIILDRENFPYFYRTIGSNQQYEDVFAKIFAHYSWKRIAAITEDGQKYTEYISRMDSSNNSFKLINRKFPREKTPKLQIEYFEKLLKELKSSNHHIIICDVHDHILMKSLMCTASRLKMTAKDGYVWFLPVYVTIKMNETDIMNNNQSCTASELRMALDEHFSLSYANFGNDDDTLPSKKTVEEWKNQYKAAREISTISPSDYAPFVYDAIWVYAKTLMQLISEDSSDSTSLRSKPKHWYMNNLDSTETLQKMIQIFESMDFQGVSGRIQFNNVGSRYTNVSILRWLNNDFTLVGNYTPIILNKTIIDAKLSMDDAKIIFSPAVDDGSESCLFEFFAEAIGAECHSVTSFFIIIFCFFVILACSGLSFLFWKHKYAQKLEESAQIMKNYGRVVNGIELSKWEISRENVIINRRIGEGAFGTVYGGEALLKNENCWIPVAIKTLKVGNNPEQRLDFLAESEIMKRFDHKNIVKLLAVCLQKDPLLACMEFMLYGDLKTYLLSRRHLVNDRVNEDSNDISPKRLTLMALDVARGLAYLASLNYVHRDIALRNCLINAQRIVKIGDFGMCRSTCENDYYRFTRKGMLPIRWMAPESVDGCVFSHASDVWSFGVFLYEVITLGAFPFQGLSNNQVFELVKQGESVKIPQQCKTPLKMLMSMCFNFDPKKRPKASDIVEIISNSPRMLSPCMTDIPKPNLDEQVNLIDADINEDFEFDQLKDNREHTPAITIDFLRPSASSSALQNNSRNQEFEYLDMKQPKRMNGNGSGFCNYSPDLTATLPNNYNPVEPLLKNPRSTEISKSTLSLLNKYVPMCGFNKNRNRSSPEECTECTSAL